MISMDMLHDAQQVLAPVISRTPMVSTKGIVPGCDFYLKADCLQKTGAFKLRGAYYKTSLLSEEQKARGLITASAGNHAQGVAYAAQAAGVPATIVMPTTTPLVKVNNTKDYGAQVILHGEVFDDAALLAEVRKRFPIAEAETTCITEDFSEYQRHAPGVFFFLGTGGIELHAPTFTFPEEILDKGEALLCGLV